MTQPCLRSIAAGSPAAGNTAGVVGQARTQGGVVSSVLMITELSLAARQVDLAPSRGDDLSSGPDLALPLNCVCRASSASSHPDTLAPTASPTSTPLSSSSLTFPPNLVRDTV